MEPSPVNINNMNDNIDDNLSDNEPTIEKPLSRDVISNENDLTLEYGDIIELQSKSNPLYQGYAFYVSYRDENQVEVNNLSTGDNLLLHINENGYFSDESIESIILISRSDSYGYSRQNSLFPKTWIEIHIGGDVKQIITGEITDLEEDQIEVTTYPELNVFYIDFAYKGLPKDIPIDTIQIREKPEALENIGSLNTLREAQADDELSGESLDEFHEPATIDFTDDGESIITLPEGTATDETFKEDLQQLYIDARDIIFEGELETLKHVVEVPENEIRYSIETQVSDLMDGLLSTIPTHRRTVIVMESIHRLISRFKDLREKYSNYNDFTDITGRKTFGKNYKPLVDKLKKMDMNLKWLLPVVSTTKYISIKNNESNELPFTDDTRNVSPLDHIKEASNIFNEFHTSKTSDVRGNYTDTYNLILDKLHDTYQGHSHHLQVYNSNVNGHIEGIVSNLDSFYSGVESGVKKLFVQTYNIGLSKLIKNKNYLNKHDYERIQMTPNDNICIKSFIMMPQQVVSRSSMYFPNKMLIDKVNMHKNPIYSFKLLHKNRSILPRLIDDLSKELSYGKDGEMLSDFQEISIEDDNFQEERNLYERYLQTFIPNTSTILDSIRMDIDNKYSFVNVVNELEPYGIYNEHITFDQYTKIQYIIRSNIKKLKEYISIQSRMFNGLKENNVLPYIQTYPILQLISNKSEILQDVFACYKLNENTRMTKHELYNHIFMTDNQTLLTSFISSMLIPLVTPSNLLDTLYPSQIDSDNDNEGSINLNNGNCGKKYIAKKYHSISELESDNGIEASFDSEYDNTPYDILITYKEEHQDMSEDLFKEFLENVLVKKHHMAKNDASDTAINLLINKKMIQDGHYALLETNELIDNEPHTTREYYIRKGNQWIRDMEINENSFLDTASIFCNISNECFMNKTNGVCEDSSISAMRHRQESRKQLHDEFDRRIKVNVSEMETELQTDIKYLLKHVRRTQAINDIKTYRANNLAFEIGQHVSHSETIQSPHEKVFNRILSSSDFVKKQHYITLFVKKFCRLAIDGIEENPHWMYCKDTNVPIVPVSISKLADSFLLGYDKYQQTLEELRVSNGMESDNGGEIVDKYSGYVLCRKDFNIDEGFTDEGFKIVTRDIIQEDTGISYLKQKQKEASLRENPENERIDIIYLAMIERIGLPPNLLHEFVIRISSELILKELYTKEKYERLRRNKIKKMKDNNESKPMDSYDVYLLQSTILIVSSVIFVGIQTMVPSINLTKTFPNCIRSYSGYPLTRDDDLSGIEYVSCILHKLKSSYDPWLGIRHLSMKTLTSRIHKVISKTLIEHPEVSELYLKKIEYNQLQQSITIPINHSIQKWSLFQPSVVPILIETPTLNVSDTYQQELLQELKRGKMVQFQMVHMLHSKNALFSYRLQQSIHSIVKDEEALLHTSGLQPFQQNACCHSKHVQPMTFFKDKDHLLDVYIENVRKNQSFLSGFKKTTQARLLYHDEPTGMDSHTVQYGNMEEQVYSAIIKYCKYDTQQPVPDDLKTICSEKPPNYRSSMSLSEKITVLKRSGKKYDETDLKNIMNIVHRNNIVDIDVTSIIEPVENLKEYIQHLDDMDNDCVSSKLRELLMDVVNNYNPNVMKGANDESLNELESHLYWHNKNIITEINSFMEYNNESSVSDLLTNIEELKYYEESQSGFFNVCKNLKNKIYKFSMLYPNFLQSKKGLHGNFYIYNKSYGSAWGVKPNLWGIASDHFDDLRDLHNKYYNPINKFYNDDVLLKILALSEDNLGCLYNFANVIPLYKNKKVGDEKQFLFIEEHVSIMLLKYVLLEVIYQYITSANSNEIVVYTTKKILDERREQLSLKGDAAYNSSTIDLHRNEQNTDVLNNIDEVEIDLERDYSRGLKTSQFISSILEIELSDKLQSNISYDDAIRKVSRSKDNERKAMTDYFGSMDIKERKVVNAHKKYKLGEWNIGTSHYKYSAANYVSDKNRTLGFFEGANEYNVEQPTSTDIIPDNDDPMQVENIENIDRDTHDFQHLSEDYQDGDFYPEDRDPDDFYGDT